MDPKQQLDPKLKEAYERVMNATFQPGSTPAPATPPPTPQPQQAKPTTPAPQTPASAATPKPAQSESQGTDFVSKPPKPKKKISPVIIVLGVLLFFLAYTVIWIKIFNLSLPFASSGTNNPKSGQSATQTTIQAPQPTQPPAPTTQPPIVTQPTTPPVVTEQPAPATQSGQPAGTQSAR